MIRLRRDLERGARHPILGPLLILLLVLMLAFTVAHEGNEAAGAKLAELCVGIALILLAFFALSQPSARAGVAVSILSTRAPPRDPRTERRFVPFVPDFLPLRL